MEAVLPAAAAGALIGLAVRAALPARRDLASVLDRLDVSKTSNPLLPTTAPTSTGTLPERVGARLLDEFGGRITLPVKDLALLRISPAEHLGKRFLFALYGLVLPQLLQA
ncbi:type II secretion system F family protein, partial [Streptomyces mirabilis]